MAVLESRLVIKAVDETAKAFEEVQKRIASVEKSAAAVERVLANMGNVASQANLFGGAGQRAEMDQAIANMERLIRLTEEAASAQRGLAQSARAAGTAMATGSRAGEAGMERVGVGARRASGARGHGGQSIIGGAVETVTGFLPIAAAFEGAELAKKAVENAADLEQLRFRIRELSRNDPSEAPMADKLAGDVAAKYPGITRSKALDTYTELRANSVDEHGRVDPAIASRNLMTAARAQNAALALGFDMSPEDMQNLLKGVEGSGRANDPKAVEKISDAYIRAKQIFGSAIASNMIRDYTANAKSANFSIGDDQFYLSNLVRMSEGNASRLGNEVNQTLATMVGGHMTKATGAWMVAHGLATADQIVKTGPGTISIKGGLKDQDTLQTDQGTWAATTLKKAIEDSGAISEDKVSARAEMLRAQELKRNPNAEIDNRFLRERAEEGLISAEIAKTGMRSSVTDNLAHFIGNQRLIERDVAAMQNASGLGAGDRISQNPVAGFSELTSALSNFGTVLLSPALSNAGPILDGLAHGIQSLTAGLQAAEDWAGDKINKAGKFLTHKDAPAPADFDWLLRKSYANQADNHPILHGEQDMDGARGRAMSGLGEQHGPIQVESTVHGDATVKAEITVTASSELLAVVQAAKTATAQMPLNPVATGHSGRMDSDAAPSGHGGIGHH